MLQNIFSAVMQMGASLGIAFLSIAMFRFLTPEQVAYLRQYYFVPFALITSFAPANQNYLRSILFSSKSKDVLDDAVQSLMTVQCCIGIIFFIAITFSFEFLDTPLTVWNIAALFAALVLVLFRTFVTGFLEFNGNYTLSIGLNNLGSVIPYVAVFSVFFSEQLWIVFLFSTLLSGMNIALVVAIAICRVPAAVRFPCVFSSSFLFDGWRYTQLALIAAGSVIVYQGVEFCLYNLTHYNDTEIANYALAFSACAILRQIIIVALQPLEHEKNFKSSIRLYSGFILPRSVAMEMLIYFGLITTVFILPQVLFYLFPDFESAGLYIRPLIVGVLGSAIQQIYTVRMVAASKTYFLGISQVVLAISCIVSVVFLHSYMSLYYLILIVATLIWVRGCIFVPGYAGIISGEPCRALWISRIGLSAIFFYLAATVV